MTETAFSLNRALRVGYLGLAVFLAAFLARRGVDGLRDRVLGQARFAFDPQCVRVLPRPRWAGAAFDAVVIRTLEPLRGSSVLHPDFWPSFQRALETVPWIRAVRDKGLGRAGTIRAWVRYRRPVARLAGENRLVDGRGVRLPDAGRPLRLPWIRLAAGGSVDPVSRLVAAGEVAFLLARTGGRGFLWGSLEGVEVATARRGDGGGYHLLDLVFRRRDDGGSCRIRWGRGTAEARPGDLSAEVKLDNLRRILHHVPGWGSIRGGVVFVRRAMVETGEPRLEASAGPDRFVP